MEKNKFLLKVLGKDVMSNFHNKINWEYDCWIKTKAFLEFKDSIDSFFDSHEYSSYVFFVLCCSSEWFRNSSFFSQKRISELYLKEPDNALLYAFNYLTKEQIIECSKLSPFRGLCMAYNVLPKEVINEIAIKEPITALKYCPELLDYKTFDYCVRKSPSFALGFGEPKNHNPNKFLTKEQIDYCVKKRPIEAYIYAKHMLSKEQLDFCIKEKSR